MCSRQHFPSVLVLCFLCLYFAFQVIAMYPRNKRFLIFPRQAPTRHQFIGGIGIPADLSYESLTIGHVLKAEFFLPYNATVFRENPFLPEYKADFNNTNLNRMLQSPTGIRWNIYAYIEHRLDSYGYKGRECMLKSICEANAVRFARHFSIAAELLHLLLSPTSSLNGELANVHDYIEAANLGFRSNKCDFYAYYPEPNFTQETFDFVVTSQNFAKASFFPTFIRGVVGVTAIEFPTATRIAVHYNSRSPQEEATTYKGPQTHYSRKCVN